MIIDIMRIFHALSISRLNAIANSVKPSWPPFAEGRFSAPRQLSKCAHSGTVFPE